MQAANRSAVQSTERSVALCFGEPRRRALLGAGSVTCLPHDPPSGLAVVLTLALTVPPPPYHHFLFFKDLERAAAVAVETAANARSSSAATPLRLGGGGEGGRDREDPLSRGRRLRRESEGVMLLAKEVSMLSFSFPQREVGVLRLLCICYCVCGCVPMTFLRVRGGRVLVCVRACAAVSAVGAVSACAGADVATGTAAGAAVVACAGATGGGAAAAAASAAPIAVASVAAAVAAAFLVVLLTRRAHSFCLAVSLTLSTPARPNEYKGSTIDDHTPTHFFSCFSFVFRRAACVRVLAIAN